MAAGVVVVRPLGQGGQEGGLGRSQLLQRLAEVVVGRRRHAVRPIAEENLVQIQLEDLFLGQGRFKPAGENRLLQLAVDAGRTLQDDVLGHLLSDGRTPFQPPAGQDVEHVLEHGPTNAGHVDSTVREEVAVLCRQEGLHHGRRDLVIRHIDSALVRKLADQGAIAGIDARGGGRPIVRQLRCIRQIMEQPGGIDRHDQPRQGDRAKQANARHNQPTLGYLHPELRRTPDTGLAGAWRIGKGVRATLANQIGSDQSGARSSSH